MIPKARYEKLDPEEQKLCESRCFRPNCAISCPTHIACCIRGTCDEQGPPSTDENLPPGRILKPLMSQPLT
jgi:hypothetical protein